MPTYKRPKMIIHVEQTSSDVENAEDIITKMAVNMSMTDNETALLLAYAQFKDGFRPAMGLLHEKTGIPKPTLKSARNNLQKRNIIMMHRDHLYLRWGDYKAICMADPYMMKEGLKGKPVLRPFFIYQMFNELTDDDLAELFCDRERLIETLQNAKEYEAEILCKKMSSFKKRIEKQNKKEVYFLEHPDEHANKLIEDINDFYERSWTPPTELPEDIVSGCVMSDELPF